MRIVTPSEMGKIEIESERFGVSREKLMDNAGKKLAKFISEISREKGFSKILFLCGKGNNGGDCFVAGRELIYSGYDVSFVSVCGLPTTEIAKNAYNTIPKDRAKFFCGFQSDGMKTDFESAELAFMTGGLYKDSATKIPPVEKLKMRERERITSIINAISEADVVVDGVFGTGFHGEIENETAEYFKLAESKLKIAVDVPSGANCISGKVAEGAFKADYTAVFGYIKSGMTQYPLREHCGELKVFDIGIPERALNVISDSKEVHLIDEQILKGYKQYRRPDSHKGDFGKMLSITGCDRMRGASVMSTMSALRSGVGILTVASSRACTDNVSIKTPEAMTISLASDKDGYILFMYQRSQFI